MPSTPQFYNFTKGEWVTTVDIDSYIDANPNDVVTEVLRWVPPEEKGVPLENLTTNPPEPNSVPNTDESITSNGDIIYIFNLIPPASRTQFKDKTKPPKDLDYKTGLTTSLYPKETMVKGEVTKVEYFADSALTIPVLDVDITYVRDSLGFALERTTTRTWYKNDGTPSTDSKITHKDYTVNNLKMINEGKRRRGNIIDDLIIKFSGIVAQATANPNVPDLYGKSVDEALDIAREFFASNSEAVNTFIHTSRKQVFYNIQNDITNAWLDDIEVAPGVTLRLYTMSLVDIWGLLGS